MNVVKDRCPCAKLLRNYCAILAERNAKCFFCCASVLREKTTTCAIIAKVILHKIALFRFSQLKFCAMQQFRKNHPCAFLGIERFLAGI